MMKILNIGVLCASAAAFHVAPAVPSPVARVRAAVRLFEETKTSDNFELPSTVTRSRDVGQGRSGSIVVTDGSGSFFASRAVFQSLYDFGGYASITASTGAAAEAKKVLLSRKSRYSGLNDVLSFVEGEALAEAMEGAEAWLAINAEEAALPAQLEVAKAAGVSRVFVVLCEDGPTSALADVAAVESALKGSGMTYTVMRTGKMVASLPTGGGLKLDDIDVPTCEAVGADDVFRFITESLTLPEASDRLFSLCPAEGVASTLKQMRLAGYERRAEVELLLQGLLKDETAPPAVSAEEAQETAELVMRSEAEVEAERQEELAALLARARQRGEETQARLKYEADEKAANRKEQEKYYQAPRGDDADGGAEPTADAAEEDEAKPPPEAEGADGAEPPKA